MMSTWNQCSTLMVNVSKLKPSHVIYLFPLFSSCVFVYERKVTQKPTINVKNRVSKARRWCFKCVTKYIGLCTLR